MALILWTAFLVATQDNQAQFDEVKLFESGRGLTDFSERQYLTRFPRSATRYVCVEVGAKNLLYRKRAQTCKFTVRVLNADGSLRGEFNLNPEIPADWASFVSADGWGWAKPGTWPVGLYRVEVWMASSKLGETSFSVYDDLSERPPFASTADENLRIARERQRIGDGEGALLFCGRALDLNPRFAEGFVFRAQIHLRSGSTEEALADVGRALAADPRHAEAVNTKGRILAALGRLDEAIAEYGRAIELKPAAAYYRNRSLSRKAKGDLDGALDDLERTIRVDARSADAYNDRGTIREQKGDKDNALQDYSRAIELDAQHPYAFRNRALILRARGQRYKAFLDLAQAVKSTVSSVRSAAADDLGDLGLTDGADVIADLLADDDAEVRRRAAWSMGRLDGRAYARDLSSLMYDSSAWVRWSAAIALGEIGAKEYKDTLVMALEDDDMVVRAHAAISLCRMGVKDSMDKVLALLKSEDAHPRGDAVEALGFLGDPKYAEEVGRMLRDKDHGVRMKAIASLGKLGAKEFAPDIAAFVEDLHDSSLYDPETRNWADAATADVAARVLRDWGVDASAYRTPDDPKIPNLVGTWEMRKESEPQGAATAEIKVVRQKNGRFFVRGVGQSWEADGTLEGNKGHYDWRFGNGASGKTVFEIAADGTLRGQVQGEGPELNWKFIARRK
ncbi:MAG TPA: HEAT repeat domain-containing protein [Planctomycetota bacterium]|nr:HEAT repeat domain-containing protein [Planctomycetota bacterium]